MVKQSKKPSRLTRGEWLMSIATASAERATCTRAKVGAVIARDGHVLATGYNGSPAGQPHCIDEGCLVFETRLAGGELEKNCKRTVHAEMNAIIQAARHGTAIAGATIFCTHSPCLPCFMAIVNAGIAQVVFTKPYKLELLVELLQSSIGAPPVQLMDLEHYVLLEREPDRRRAVRTRRPAKLV